MSLIDQDKSCDEVKRTGSNRHRIALLAVNTLSFILAVAIVLPEKIALRTIEVAGVFLVVFGAGLLAWSVYGLYFSIGRPTQLWAGLIVSILIPIVYYKAQFNSNAICDKRVQSLSGDFNRFFTRKLGLSSMPKIALRLVIDSDLPIFFKHQQHQPALHMAAFVHEDPSDRAHFDAHWGKLMGSSKILKRSIIADKQLVGHIMSFEMDGDREITYWIDHHHWGKGIASEALRLFLDCETTRPLYGRSATDNKASIHSMEKNGFVLIANERGFANARGEEIDEVVMKLA